MLSLQALLAIILWADEAQNPAQRTKAGRDAGPTPPRRPSGQPGSMTSKSRRNLRKLSLPLVVLAAVLFASGMAAGYVTYLHRSPVLHRYVPGTSAWWQQLAVAVLGCALFGYARWRQQRTPGRHGARLWLLAPLGKAAARRVNRTVLGGDRRPSGPGRALLALPLTALFLYGFYRAGEQITAGLDPNFTVNAWGGPTYLGAMACHYLDLFLLMTAAAWVLNRILPPDPTSATAKNAPPSRAPGAALPEQTRTDGFNHAGINS